MLAIPSANLAQPFVGGIESSTVSPVLDECWRQYMAQRPSDADNLTFTKERIAKFKPEE